MKLYSLLALVGLSASFALANESSSVRQTSLPQHRGALAGCRYRVVVSTDIGGTDPDDLQSMVHLLLYADVLDIEGLISSPYGSGRAADILRVIECYAADYPTLQARADAYPTADVLRALTKQGATEVAPYAGVRRPSEGSEWITACARRDDPRPLHVLVWGGLEDLAQALHDAPDILPKLRVYWIGGPNKKWSHHAYQYIVEHHRNLWIIEANSTYRGWFVGGDQSGEWSNAGFVARHVADHGALGRFFSQQLGGVIKMGDSPSVGWLLVGTPEDPSQPGWGGQFVRAWRRPHGRFERMPTREDRMEVFGVLEIVLNRAEGFDKKSRAVLVVENQELTGHVSADGTIRFRFCPKAAKRYEFTIRSNVSPLDGMTGGIMAALPAPEATQRRAAGLANWWTDHPAPEYAEDEHFGAKTVSRWRREFLEDFAVRMDRCLDAQ